MNRRGFLAWPPNVAAASVADAVRYSLDAEPYRSHAPEYWAKAVQTLVDSACLECGAEHCRCEAWHSDQSILNPTKAGGLKVGTVSAGQHETQRDILLPMSDELYEEIRQWAIAKGIQP